MKLPSMVKIVEVGPRDGFQAERQWIPTEQKIEVVNALSRSGLKDIGRVSMPSLPNCWRMRAWTGSDWTPCWRVTGRAGLPRTTKKRWPYLSLEPSLPKSP